MSTVLNTNVTDKASMTSTNKLILASICAVISGLLVLIANLVLAGWLLNIPTLKSILPDLATMKFNTALCFLLAGISLWILRDRNISGSLRRIARVCGFLVFALSALTLGEYVFGWNPGIDEWLIRDPGTDPALAPPGRMSAATALCFVLHGLALLSIDVDIRRTFMPSQYLALLGTLLGLVAVTGYIFGVSALYQFFLFSSMALHTAVLFVLLGAGILFARPGRGLMAPIMSELIGGLLARRLFPVAVILAIAAGWLRLQGEKAGQFETELGTAIFVNASIVIFFTVIWFGARTLNHMHERLNQRNRLYAMLSACNQLIVRVADREQLFADICDIAIRVGGFRMAWIGMADPATTTVQPVAYAGEENGFLARTRVSYADEPARQGPADTAVSAGRHIICNDIRHDPLPALWRDIALQCGYRACAAFPIVLDGKPAGALCVHAAQPQYFDDEEVRLLDEIVLDIALALKHMEFEAFRHKTERSKAYLAAIVESSDDAIVSKNPDGIITSWNSGAERIFGYTAAEIIDKPITTLIPPDRIGEEEDIISRIKRGERIKHFETVRRHRDGRLVDVSITISPIKDDSGTIIGASKIARDISELKTTQKELLQRSEELLRSNRDLAQFAYVASHDLQEPLRAVAGCVQLLRDRYQGKIDGKADEFIAHAVDGAERMQTLINDLLKFSRIDTRGGEFHPVDLSRALEAALKNLARAIEESNAVITHGNLPTISGDLTQLTLLFQNLIGNAIKFRKPDIQPCIEVASECRETQWIISVQDNGIGISSEYFERVFDVFQRLHTRREYPGTGIGLALCKRIVERHGGRIWIASEPGAGSTFFCSFHALPITDAAREIYHA